jgi:hypothetical protein
VARRLTPAVLASLVAVARSAAASPAPTDLGQVEIVLTDPCLARTGDGFSMKACADACIEKVWQWRFWYTNYNVSGSWGYGEHQGIGIFGFEYSYDPRFPPQDGKVRAPWARAEEHPARQRLMRPQADTPAAAVEEHALCAAPLPTFERFLFNHGRTLALLESGSNWDAAGLWMDVAARGTITRGPVKRNEWQSEASPVRVLVGQTLGCLARIEDGFCDSVCGNCSYVLPPLPAGALITTIENQRTQFVRGEGVAERPVRYVRTTEDGEDPTQLVTVDGTAGFGDAFTHCVADDAARPSQALASKAAWVGGNARFVTGRWGHNSNADAAAELEAFAHCGGARPDDLEDFHLACSICGERRGRWDAAGEVQWPCLDETNSAQATWRENVDRHNVDDSTLGAAPGKSPRCRGNGEPVHGM